MVDTIVKQVSLMVPGSGNAQRADIVAGHNAWRSDTRISNAIAELNIIKQRTPTPSELDAWARADRPNSLPNWLALLAELRTINIAPYTKPSTSQTMSSQPIAASALTDVPAEVDKRIIDLLTSLANGKPLQLNLMRMRDAFITTLGNRGMDVRRADSLFEMVRWEPSLSAYRPIIRELTDRLISLGNQYRTLNRPDDAARAYCAAIIALTDCVKDSPLPDVALLAADRLPVALRALDALRPTTSAATAAANLGRFHQDWRETNDHDINLLPVTFGPALNQSAHRSILYTMLNAIAFLAIGWIGAVFCLIQFIVIALTRCFGPVPLTWRWGLWGIATAVGIVVLPIFSLIAAMTRGWVPYIWLFSAPSLGGILFAPLATVLLIVVAGRICIAAAVSEARHVLPGWAITVGVLFVPIVAGMVALRVYSHGEIWRPPLNVQLFRGIGLFGGVACAVVLTTWAAWSWRRGLRLSVRPGLRARANLAVAGPVAVCFLLLAAISLFNNAANDVAHRNLFAQALADPIADRLGPDWFKTYFQPARNLADSWQN